MNDLNGTCGTVVSYNHRQGFGWVRPWVKQSGDPDVFVHYTSILNTPSLYEGDEVFMHVVDNGKGPIARPATFIRSTGTPMRGTVTRYGPRRYGFIHTPKDEVVFFHHSGLYKSPGIQHLVLHPGDQVVFFGLQTEHGPKAVRISPITHVRGGEIVRFDPDRACGWIKLSNDRWAFFPAAVVVGDPQQVAVGARVRAWYFGDPDLRERATRVEFL